MTETRTSSQTSTAPEPWWRVRMVWLVIGGPLVVVIASFVTLGLAIKHPDPVLQSTAADETNSSAPVDAAHTPAMQARNHAATGGR